MIRRVLLIAFLLPAVLARGRNTRADFIVHTDRYVAGAFVGFGADMNPYLYCRPNWGIVNEQNVADLEKKIIDLAPQHVRIFFLNSWMTTGSDKFVSKDDPRTYGSFVRTVRLAQKAGASVNLTLWFDPMRWRDPDSYATQFAHNLAKLLTVEHLDAIRYVTIQNEPDESPRGNETPKITLPKYVQAYTTFDRVMRELGLRDRIKIVAGDLLSDQQPKWVAYLGPALKSIADGYSIHGYWNYWDPQKIIYRLDSSEYEFANLPASQQKPLYITEFGTRGYDMKHFDPGLYSNGHPIALVPIQSVENAWFMLKAVNDGFVSLVQWDMYDAHYEVLMHYGLIGQVEGGWPLKPGYFLMKLLTHTCQPGWRAVQVEGWTSSVTAAAMKSPDGQISIWGINHGAGQAKTTFSGLAPNQDLHLWYWNAHGDGQISDGQMVHTNAHGEVKICIPFQAMAAITNRDFKN